MPAELLLTAPYALRPEPYDEPPLKAGEVRAQAALSALSQGTEVSLYRGTTPFHDRAFDPELRLFYPAEAAQSYPTRLGYEWVGRVTEVAPNVTGFAAAEMAAIGVGPLAGLEPARLGQPAPRRSGLGPGAAPADGAPAARERGVRGRCVYHPQIPFRARRRRLRARR